MNTQIIRKVALRVGLAGGALILGAIAAGDVPTTRKDFFVPGTQAGDLADPLIAADYCGACHGYYDEAVEPFANWSASMMGQATRDPIFHAAMTIANQDAAFAGALCLRCHSPVGEVNGHNADPSGAGLTAEDKQGITCHVCHRMVNPFFDANTSPPEDSSIVSGQTYPVTSLHSASFLLDPQDRRRGPYTLDIFPHQWIQSPFHRTSALCGTCHDVSNPAFSRQPDGTYALNDLNSRAPSDNKYDQFPVERTFSEWSNSSFALGPVDLGGRFGGNTSSVSTCQDCHMPRTTGVACDPLFGPTERPDLAVHQFNGGNTWVLRAIDSLYPQSVTYMTDNTINNSIAHAETMLRNASDVELTQNGSTINVRVINWTGHKLPTGYPEGRRMWVNVRFFDAQDNIIAEHGAYDAATATLTTAETKVYETQLGMSPDVAAATGNQPGPSFHFAINNVREFDNRIPPLGFTNAAFNATQCGPVGATYADGQHWDDTAFSIPLGAVRAEARVFYQSTSKEYIEFLRDYNGTNTDGQIAYDQWALHGKSTPVEMDFASIDVPPCPSDYNLDGAADLGDVFDLVNDISSGTESFPPNSSDVNQDGSADLGDVLDLSSWIAGACP